MNASSLQRRFEAGPQWVAGFMSGTSLDGVDAALIATDGVEVASFGPWMTAPYSSADRDVLERATLDARAWAWAGEEPASFAEASRVMTRAHVEALRLLMTAKDCPVPILVGFHGQTVLHRPPSPGLVGRTRQLGDPELMAQLLGLPVVFDLRAADVAAGGQGAPLAPAYHAALLARQGRGAAAALNIGGVANITARASSGEIVAFDTGPGNGPIDEWMAAHGAGRYDADGRSAAQGRIRDELVAEWLSRPYFTKAPPKSLDRYDFSADLAKGLSLEDGAATLTAFSAAAMLAGIARLAEPPELVVATGGGRLNPVLMAHLRAALGARLVDAADLGWRGDAIEAEAWAFLAVRSVRELPVSFPTTTGVRVPLTGGVLVTP